VVILGLGGAVSEFREAIGELAVGRRVLAFDNRGAGRSGQPDSAYSIEMMADDTAGLMRAVGIGRADVVGISLGGRIAVELAVRHSELVRRLVLVSAAARTVNTLRRRFVMGFWSRVRTGPGPRHQRRYAFERQVAASTRYDGREHLRRITQPTLILHGRQDRSTPYRRAEELHAGIAGSRLVTFSGGHRFHLQGEREPFLETVTAFLD
jgi:pimeloyl-ACP methyl ester carboxylesterase